MYAKLPINLPNAFTGYGHGYGYVFVPKLESKLIGFRCKTHRNLMQNP